MEGLLSNLLENCNLNDTFFETCINFLQQTPLTQEQYEMIMEVCQYRIDNLIDECNVEKIKNIINDLKQTLHEESEFYMFLDGLYKIKAYINDENEITEKNPTIEHVIEFNYKKQNITLFHITIYDNQNDTIKTETSIQVEPEKDDESMEDSDSDSMKTEEMDNVITFEKENCKLEFIKSIGMNQENSLELFNTLLNTFFSIFESETPLSW
jgi:flagellin-specific chaperone FliS